MYPKLSKILDWGKKNQQNRTNKKKGKQKAKTKVEVKMIKKLYA